MYIDSPSVQKLLQRRMVAIVDAAIVAQFDAYLRRLSWSGGSLDWSSMPPSETFRLTVDNESAAVAWVLRMAIGKNSHVVAAYQRGEPGVMCTVDVAIRNLGSLFANAPGYRFFFGTDRSGNHSKYGFADLMEFDGGEVLTAVR